MALLPASLGLTQIFKLLNLTWLSLMSDVCRCSCLVTPTFSKRENTDVVLLIHSFHIAGTKLAGFTWSKFDQYIILKRHQ